MGEWNVSYIVRINGKGKGSIQYLDPQGNETEGKDGEE